MASGLAATSVFSFIVARNGRIVARTVLSPGYPARFTRLVRRRMARGLAARAVKG